MAETAVVSQQVKASTPRVCLLTETFYPVVGGGETHARLLARQLNAMGMHTFVLTRRSDRRFKKEELIDTIRTVRVSPHGMKRFGKYLMVIPTTLQLLRRRRDYDVIFVCGFRVLGPPAAFAARVLKKACVLRSEAMGEMSGEYASAYKKLPPATRSIFQAWIKLRNQILYSADAFVGISKAVAGELVESGVDPHKVRRITNGIDTSLFRPVEPEKKAELRKKLHLPLDKTVIVYTGKLNNGKGLEYLLEAWARLASVRKEGHLALVGSGGGQSLSCEEELRDFTREKKLSECVTFTGYVENVQEYLQAADLFVLPSENESLSISTIEAMSCGLPAIACRVGGVPDVVQHMKNGILVEPRDSSALVSAIDLLLSNEELAERLAAEARITACSKFSIKVISESYFDLFSSLCSPAECEEPISSRGNAC